MLRDHICLSIYISSKLSIYLLPSSSDILLASLSPNLCKYTFGNAHRTLQINTQTEYIWPHIWQGKHTFRPEPIKPERIADDTIESSLGGKKQNLLFKVWLLCAIKGLRIASLFSRFFFFSSSFVLVFYSSLVCFPDSFFFLCLLLFFVFLLIISLFSRLFHFFFAFVLFIGLFSIFLVLLFVFIFLLFISLFSRFFFFLSLSTSFAYIFYSSSVYFPDSLLFLLLCLLSPVFHQPIFQTFFPSSHFLFSFTYSSPSFHPSIFQLLSSPSLSLSFSSPFSIGSTGISIFLMRRQS